MTRVLQSDGRIKTIFDKSDIKHLIVETTKAIAFFGFVAIAVIGLIVGVTYA